MAKAVLDASAVLAVLNDEPGADIVKATLQDALLLTVNYAEVISKLVERGGAMPQVLASLRAIDIQLIAFDQSLAERAGSLRAETQNKGLSLADRACLALAEREGAPALTGDRNWRGAIPGVNIRLIR